MAGTSGRTSSVLVRKIQVPASRTVAAQATRVPRQTRARPKTAKSAAPAKTQVTRRPANTAATASALEVSTR